MLSVLRPEYGINLEFTRRAFAVNGNKPQRQFGLEERIKPLALSDLDKLSLKYS